MITGPNWKPTEFSEAELDEIEARRPMLATCEELIALAERALSRMSPEEKRSLRAAAEEDLQKARRARDDRLLRMPCPPRLQ